MILARSVTEISARSGDDLGKGSARFVEIVDRKLVPSNRMTTEVLNLETSKIARGELLELKPTSSGWVVSDVIP